MILGYGLAELATGQIVIVTLRDRHQLQGPHGLRILECYGRRSAAERRLKSLELKGKGEEGEDGA